MLNLVKAELGCKLICLLLIESNDHSMVESSLVSESQGDDMNQHLDLCLNQLKLI